MNQWPPPPAGYPSSSGDPYSTNTVGYATFSGYPSGSAQHSYSTQHNYGKTPPYGKQPPPAQPHGFDVEAQQAAIAASQFADVRIRSAFVRKVFSLVFLMLSVTIGVACVFLFVVPVREYVAGYDVPCSSALTSDKTVYQRGSDGTCFVYGDGRWLFWMSWGLTFVSLIALSCFGGLRRRVPWNYLALGFFTAVMSLQVGCIVAYWNLSVVLIAFAVTGGATVGIFLGALFIPWDFTKKKNALGIVSLVVLFVAIVTIIVGFFWSSKWWYLALSVVIALLFAAWLWFDIQLIVGKVRWCSKCVCMRGEEGGLVCTRCRFRSHSRGRHQGRYKMDPDEYVFGALTLYLDIVIMFLNILNVVGIAS